MEQYTRATVPTTPYSFMGIKAEAIADADKITHEVACLSEARHWWE